MPAFHVSRVTVLYVCAAMQSTETFIFILRCFGESPVVTCKCFQDPQVIYRRKSAGDDLRLAVPHVFKCCQLNPWCLRVMLFLDLISFLWNMTSFCFVSGFLIGSFNQRSPFFPLLRHSYQSLDKLVVLLLSLRGPAFLLVQPSTFGNSKFSLISDQNTVKLTYT